MSEQEFDEFLKLLENCPKEDIEEMQKLYDEYVEENNCCYYYNENVHMNISKECTNIGEPILFILCFVPFGIVIAIICDIFFRR